MTPSYNGKEDCGIDFEQAIAEADVFCAHTRWFETGAGEYIGLNWPIRLQHRCHLSSFYLKANKNL